MTIYRYCTVVRDALMELAEEGAVDVLRDGMVACSAVTLAQAGQAYAALNLAQPLAEKYLLGTRLRPRGGARPGPRGS